jgi:hypothetical protein
MGLRFLDLYITYLYTPDLEHEWNPLVSVFGVSWTGFIFVQLLIVAFVSLMMFFYFTREHVTIKENNLNFYDFIYVYFFGKLRPWPGRIFTVPNNYKRHLVFNGFLFMFLTMIISIFAITHNLLLMAEVYAYVSFVSEHYRSYIPICFILVTAFSVYFFFGREYLRYRRSCIKT